MRNRSRFGCFKTADVVWCGLFAALLSVGAWIRIMIPIGVFQVTFSLQLLFALLAGLLLGPEKGLCSVVSYLLIGLSGVPVFAHGGGLAYLARPTFGFLIGFATAAYIAGACAEQVHRGTIPRLLFSAFCGEMAYYGCGLLYYFISFNYILTHGTAIGVRELLTVWFLSTVIPDFLLCVMASLLAARLLPQMKYLRKNGGRFL